MRCLWLLLTLAGFPAFGQPLLPRCGPGLDGQVAANGCGCGHQGISILSGQPAGWRWTCDLLREGAARPAPTELPGRGNDLPNGFVYAPQSQAGQGTAARPGY